MSDQPDYRALYEEERRARQEAELEAQRAREAERETANFVQLLQEEIEKHKAEVMLIQEELQEHKDEIIPQSLPAYLTQTARLQLHAVRLLPRRAPRQPTQPRSSSRSRANSSQPTTSGRTDIDKKFYPLRLQPWTDFSDVVQRDGFARIYAVLQPGEGQEHVQNGLPSRYWVQRDEETLLGELPLQALEQDGALNAIRTNEFLKMVLLTPASRVLNQYLQGVGSDEKVFFDAAVQKVAIDVPSALSTQIAEAGSPSSSSSMPQIPKKAKPDCVVLTMLSGAVSESAGAETAARRIALGEHKPCHALRAASVLQIIDGPLPEDYMIRLASEALARREKKKAAAERLARGLEPEAESGLGPVAAASRTGKISKQAYFGFALTQVYHYMLVGGVEFGYLATGEIIVFLRIPEDDPTTLYYHVALFPIAGPSAEPGTEIPNSVTGEPFSEETETMAEAGLRELPVAQMASFCDLALRSPLRPTVWITEATQSLAHFPELPLSVAAQYGRRPSSTLSKRGRDDDDDGSNDNGNNDGSRENDDSRDDHGPSSSRGQQHSQFQSSTIRTPSTLRQELTAEGPGPIFLHISTSFLSTRCDLRTRPRPSRQVLIPALDYCTQACLLGLVRNGPLDKRCPNYELHRAAADKNGCGNGHAITQLELAQGIRDQLWDTPEVNCECYAYYRGAIGYPFKLTLTGYGYTFVGKGVDEVYRGRLLHESRIYRDLFSLQGSVIPVHLGLLKLHVAYPVPSLFLQLPYMMLLSYAGESTDEVDETALAGIDLEAETARTMRELADWGLYDEDENIANLRWCREVGRVMRIDFDRAELFQSRHRSQITASSDATATPQITDGAYKREGAHIEDEEQPVKRIKCSNDAGFASTRSEIAELKCLRPDPIGGGGGRM